MPTNLAEEDYYDYFGRPKGGWCRENTMKMAKMVMERRSESTFLAGGDGDEGGEIERREEGRVARNLAESNFHY